MLIIFDIFEKLGLNGIFLVIIESNCFNFWFVLIFRFVYCGILDFKVWIMICFKCKLILFFILNG